MIKFFPRAKYGLLKVFMVDRVGKILGFKAESAAFLVDCAVFALNAVQEIAGIKLYAGHGGFQLERDTTFIVISRHGITQAACCAPNRIAVVIPPCKRQRRIIRINPLSDGAGLTEIHRGALNRKHSSRGYKFRVGLYKFIGINLHILSINRSAVMSRKIEIGVVGKVANRGLSVFAWYPT